MTALSDALAAAQSRAVAALSKQYVGGQVDGDELRFALVAIGLCDATDTEQWMAALDIIRATGATAPAESRPATNGKADESATEAQLKLLRRLCEERELPVPNVPLTKAQASELIERVKAGTYTPDEWVMPV